MTDLTKFTTCDLLKTYDEIGKHLMKVAPEKTQEIITKIGGTDMVTKVKKESEYDPNQATPKTTVEEKDKPGAKAVAEVEDAKMAVGKDDIMGGVPAGGVAGGDQVSPGTQAEVLQHILAAIVELKTLISREETEEQQEGETKEAAYAPPAALRGQQVKMADKDVKDEEKEEKKEKEVEKRVAEEVTKQIQKEFAKLGVSKTQKPSESPDHPIQKGQMLSMDEIGKMSWREIDAFLETH